MLQLTAVRNVKTLLSVQLRWTWGRWRVRTQTWIHFKFRPWLGTVGRRRQPRFEASRSSVIASGGI